MKKLKNIQGLRGIAVLFVIFFHLLLVEEKYDQNSLIPKFFSFGVSGVDIFFVISGFVIVAVTRGQFNIKGAPFRFIYHRISRIYPLYWIYSTIVLVLFLIKPTWVNSAQGNQVDIVSSFLLLPQNMLPLVNVGWSLIHEMYFYGFFFSLMLLIPEKMLAQVLSIWASAICIYQTTYISDNAWLKLIFHPLTLEFIGGCFIALYYYSTENHCNKNSMRLLAILGLVLLVGHYKIEQFNKEIYLYAWWWRVLTLGIPSLCIVHALVQLERNLCFFPSWLNTIGDASFSLYLSHIMVLSTLGRMWRLFPNYGIWDNLIAIPLLIAGVLSYGLISYRLLEKPIMQICRKIA